MDSVGFKEWAVVCEALGRGEQTVLVRKGGIAEGRDGFAFKHAEFFLFPTFFHEQMGKTRLVENELPVSPEGEVEVGFLARVETAGVITSWERALALEPFHILRREVVRERFDYNEAPGIHVAFVRVFRLVPRWRFPDAPAYGGCRSWVKLPELPRETQLEAILSGSENAVRLGNFRRLVSPSR